MFSFKPAFSLKKKYNVKVENYALFYGFVEDLRPGDSLSESSEGLPKEVRKGPGYIVGFAHTHTHTYTRAHTHTCMHMHTHTHTHTYTHMHTHTDTHTHIHTHTHK